MGSLVDLMAINVPGIGVIAEVIDDSHLAQIASKIHGLLDEGVVVEFVKLGKEDWQSRTNE